MEDFRNVSQPTYVSLLCCGCSTATIPVAEVSHYWNIPQVRIIILILVYTQKLIFLDYCTLKITKEITKTKTKLASSVLSDYYFAVSCLCTNELHVLTRKGSPCAWNDLHFHSFSYH